MVVRFAPQVTFLGLIGESSNSHENAADTHYVRDPHSRDVDLSKRGFYNESRNMRLSFTLLTSIAVFLVAFHASQAADIKDDEVAYQNYAFQQWFGDTLVWRYDRLPPSGMVEKHRLPYSGSVYLDNRGGTAAALTKYDRAFHGGRPRAVGFELGDIAMRGAPDWAGHCNGWTAAAIRHAEPQKSVKRNGVTFTPAEIKALLAELYAYSDSEFLGGIDPAINPATLHVIITNWVGRGQHPIGMETTIGEEAWNYPVYGYKSNSQRLDARHVEVKINVAFVDFLEEEQDDAPKRYGHRYFHYMLELNGDGEIIGGHYAEDSERIDMLWVPLRPTLGGSQGNEEGNPYLDPEIVLDMWRESVPPAHRKNWYVVDPAPEDAVLDADWFSISPTPNDVRLDSAPVELQSRAMDLEAMAARTTDAADEAPSVPASRSLSPPIAIAPHALAQEDPQAHAGQDIPVPLAAGDDEPAAAANATEVFHERYPNGAIKVEREVVLDEQFNYVNHGSFRTWDEEGALIAKGRYEHGRRVGQWRRLHWPEEAEHFTRAPFMRFDAPFLSEATFENGRLHGVWSIKDAQGRCVCEVGFQHGKRHGLAVDFFPKGTPRREVEFLDGVVHGASRTYEEDGRVSEEVLFLDGRARSVEVERYVSTQKKSEVHFLSPRLVVEKPDHWWTGQRAVFQHQEEEPIQHGPSLSWYENGQERFRGSFHLGQADGEFTWWRENGQVCQKGSYLDGEQQGTWNWWHANGAKGARGAYRQGTPVGVWLWWDTEGDLAHYEEYSTPDEITEEATAPRSRTTPAETPAPVIRTPVTSTRGIRSRVSPRNNARYTPRVSNTNSQANWMR
jgi:antitoxin component YwqK of YwqJK toxin-antitoxin module